MSLPILIQTPDIPTFHTILKAEGIDIGAKNCIVIEPNGQNIQIDQVRILKKYLVNAGRSSRQIIFYSFQKATIESQNALLKLLEETGSTFRFALQVDFIGHILPTIQSRCTMIVAKNADMPKPSMTVNIEDFIGKYLFDQKVSVSKKDEADVFFLELLSILRKKMKNGERWTIPIIKKTLSLSDLLKKNNLNPQLAVDQCVLLISAVL